MKMSAILSLVLLITVTVHGESTLTSSVQTSKGLVKGKILTTIENEVEYAAFKGIPYAQPPTDYLRFKPPVETEAWTDVLNATSEGSICIQYNYTDSTVVGSEDCLYLNVYTPHVKFNESISKPVLFYIHGGAYRTGNSNASYYGPDFLLEEDIIVVTFNYRLGPLGFLNLNHDNATGNAGLKDQNLALKWVKTNIANFGGNPDNVTIAGHSAGSVSVNYHKLSNMSAELFNQSISMSGVPLCLYWGFQTSAESVEVAFTLGSNLGTTTTSSDTLLKALYAASATDIVKAGEEIALLPFRPTIESTEVAENEEKFLTECILKRYYNGDYNKGPHIMGFASNETLAFAGSASDLLDMATAGLNSIKTAAVDIDIPILSEVAALTTDAIANLSTTSLYELIKVTTDLFFITGIDSTQKVLQLHNDYPIYYYRFSFNTNYSAHKTDGIDLEGVGHEDELPYIFYRPEDNLPLNQSDIKLTRKRIVRMWTNFVKYGNPTPDGSETDGVLNVTWPDSGSSGKHLEIGTNLTVGSRPTGTLVKTFELLGLGASPTLNSCTNIISDVISKITDIIG